MTCPGCQSHTSSVLAAFQEDEPCPQCGLSAGAAFEIQTVQQSRADDRLRQRVEELVKEADQWRRRAELAEGYMNNVRESVREYDEGHRGEG